jgi:hypothetical protein
LSSPNERRTLPLLVLALTLGAASSVGAQDPDPLPVYLKDRGTGIATSMFGTYIRPGELIVYPFFEAYVDDDFEYKPEELGYALAVDFRGRYRAKEGILFFGYAITSRLAIELEAAVISASLDKSPIDPSGMPARIEESGVGDIEGQVRWRWREESQSRPELFSYFEAVAPSNTSKRLIGTAGWEMKFGTGVIRGFSWGTVSARAALEYATASTSPFDLGEYAVEYLKRVSPGWRIYLGVEGTQDELSLITEAQWHLSRFAFVRLNNGMGLTSKATDWAPEVGVVFTIPVR